MLFRSGKNWVFDLFQRRGWLVARRPVRRRLRNSGRPVIVAADCQRLEERILLSTITVTSLADTLNAGAGNGVTLRDAIEAANTDTSVDGSTAGEAGVQNMIVFQAGLNGKIALTNGQFTISSSMDIQGLGTAHTIIDAQEHSRIFDITSTAGDVTLDGLTIENGQTAAANDGGGAILDSSTGTLSILNSMLSGNFTAGMFAPGAAICSSASGAVTVTNSTLSGNSTIGVYGSGGAIGMADGAVTVTNSTLSENTTSGKYGFGGAIYSSNGAVTVTNSTLSGNSSSGSHAGGGAILTFTGAVTVTNSTLSGNSISGEFAVGGGIFSLNGAVAVTNSTIAGNHATNTQGGGIFTRSSSATITLRNTIVAQNTDNGTDPDLHSDAGILTVTHSLIGDSTGSGLIAAPVGMPDANGNLIGTHAAPIDPKLAALADNGGPTETLALLAGSPAAGAGAIFNDASNNPITSDQRGNTRYAGAVDIGAYQSATISSIARTTPAGSPTNASTVAFTVTFNEPVSGITAGTFTVNAGTLSVTPVSGSVYSVTVSGLGSFNGTLTLGFAAGQAITDAFGNPLVDTIPAGANDNTYVLDHIPPTTTLIGTFPFFAAPTNATILRFGVTFSEGVTNVNASSFQVVGTKAATTTATVVGLSLVGNSDNRFYVATVLGGDLATFNGLVGLALAPGEQITDLAGNPLPNTAPAIDESYTVDHIPPAAPTVNPLVTSSNKPILTGTWDVGTPGGAVLLQVTVNGTTFTDHVVPSGSGGSAGGGPSPPPPQLISDLAGHWTLTTIAAIPDGFYNVQVHTADAAGNSTDIAATNALIINTAAPASTELAGEYAVSTNGSSKLTLASILPSGAQLVLIGSTVAVATVANPTQLQIGGTTATYGDSVISFGSTGPFANQVWTKLDLPANYTTARGTATHVNTNGNGITFVDETGASSAGTWINPKQLTAFGATVTVGNGTLIFSNGTIWYENVSLPGTLNGAGSTNISAAPRQFTVLDFTNPSGKSVHLIETGTTSVVFVDGLNRMSLGAFSSNTQALADLYPGDTATFAGGLVLWQDGTVWTPAATPSPQITVTDYTNQNGVATHVIRNGTANVAFADGMGQLSLGAFVNTTQANSNAYPNDVATFDATTVTWQDHSVWTKTGSLTGAGITNTSPFTVVDYTNLSGTPVHLIKTGTSELIFVDGLGRISLGSFINATQAMADLYPGDTATFNGATIFWQDGSLWIPAATPSPQITVTDFLNQNGLATHIIRNGTANLAFVDGLGQFSLGTFLNATQATSNAYPNDVATFAGITVTWQDGSVWTRNGFPPITTLAKDANGALSHLKFLSSTMLIGVDGVMQGVRGTRLNGKIFWMNGQTWDNLNFNALNACFEMGTGYP